MHNGIISNSHTLKKEHEELGIVYQSQQNDGTFNDSEALAWDVALYLEGKQSELKAAGSIAFICMALSKSGKSDKLYFARNTSNPLNMVLEEGMGLMLSSEGDGELIDPHQLYKFDYRTHKLTTEPVIVPSGFYSPPTYGNYGHGYYDSDGDEDITQDYLDSLADDPDQLEPTQVISMAALLATNDTAVRKKDIQERYHEYLKQADGYYSLAYAMIQEDLKFLQIGLNEYFQENGYDDDDLVYEVGVQNSVVGILLMDPFWVGEETQHPQYSEGEKIDIAAATHSAMGFKIEPDKPNQIPLIPASIIMPEKQLKDIIADRVAEARAKKSKKARR